MNNFSTQNTCRGQVHTITVKRGYSLSPTEVVQEATAPPIETEGKFQDGILVDDVDWFPKSRFTDIIIKGHAWAPLGTKTAQLDVVIGLNDLQRRIRVFGQRTLQVGPRGLSFSAPEPFDKVPLSYAEAFGGVDPHNEKLGDLWDLKKLGASMGKDLSFMNLNRYRKNPHGKGYVLQPSQLHDGTLLPRIELADDLLTPERIPTENPINWHFKPLPASFDWMGYDIFPRSAFMGGKLMSVLNQQAPMGAFPEFAYGLTRDDLLARCTPEELLRHPRVFNGAHPAWQVPSLKGKQTITLTNMDPNQSLFSFRIPTQPPQVTLVPPADKKYTEKAFLSHVVIDMDKKRMTATWHAKFMTKKATLPEKMDKIRYDVQW